MSNIVNSGKFIKFHFNKHIKLVFLKISCLRTASPLLVKISSKNMSVGVKSLSSCFRICQNILLDACETCPKSHLQSSNDYHPNNFLQHLIQDKPLSEPHLHVKLPPQSFNTESLVKKKTLFSEGWDICSPAMVEWLLYNCKLSVLILKPRKKM